MTPMQQDELERPKPPPPKPRTGTLRPRTNGAVLLGLGVLVEGVNGALLVSNNTFSPKLIMLGTVLIPLGIWTLATGIAYDKSSGVTPPRWWMTGAIALSLAGLAIGGFLSFWLSSDFD